MSAPLTTAAINHVVLHVSDIEKSVAFYVDILGFEDRRVFPPAGFPVRFLRCGSQGLDLFQVEDDCFGGKEMNHMALEVDADSVEDTCRKLDELGIKAYERTPRTTVYIHDPDGHMIELLSRESTEWQRTHGLAFDSDSEWYIPA